MQDAVEALKHDLTGIRTGRASPGLVENVNVDYYGALTPMNQIATISTPDAKLIVVQPWDKSALSAIEKAIHKSDLGLNPVNDGNIIRIAVPPLSEERRKEMVKLVKKRVEEAKVELRNIRRDGIDRLRAAEKDKEISQDEQKRASDKIQKMTDDFVKEADEIGKGKEAELMEV